MPETDREVACAPSVARCATSTSSSSSPRPNTSACRVSRHSSWTLFSACSTLRRRRGNASHWRLCDTVPPGRVKYAPGHPMVGVRCGQGTTHAAGSLVSLLVVGSSARQGPAGNDMVLSRRELTAAKAAPRVCACGAPTGACAPPVRVWRTALGSLSHALRPCTPGVSASGMHLTASTRCALCLPSQVASPHLPVPAARQRQKQFEWNPCRQGPPHSTESTTSSNLSALFCPRPAPKGGL